MKPWRVACVIVAMVTTLARAAGNEALSIGEEISLARLAEMRTVSEAIAKLNWPGFDAASVPAVIYEPGAWALAVGFDQPPAGFNLAEGIKDGARQVYRAPAGVFKPPLRSPAQVAGKWAVVSRFDAPVAVPGAGHMGRRSSEEMLAEFTGDAFLIHLAGQRRQDSPFPVEAAAWPESAELMALTTMESRAFVASLQYRELTEKNIEEYRQKIRQAVAIRHAKWKLIGAELTSIEKEIEGTSGLARYTANLVHRLSLNQSLTGGALGEADPTFRDYSNANLLRILSAHYPLAFTADAPEPSTTMIAYRGAAMGAMLDRLNVEWRAEALKVGYCLIDAIAAKLEVRPEDDEALLATAKADFHYDALLKLAQDDLARLRQARQAALGQLFPAAPGTLRIDLSGAGGGPVETYQDDPASTVSLGEGRLGHPGGLSLKAGGLMLEVAVPAEAGSVRLMTQAGVRRDSVKSLTLRPEGGFTLTLGGKPVKPGKPILAIISGKPLELLAPGITLRMTSGSLTWQAGGPAELRPAK